MTRPKGEQVAIENLTIGQVQQIASLFGAVQNLPEKPSPSSSIGKYCVIRTRSAGVHFGVLKSKSGPEATLTEARRLWYWRGANTLHEVSLHGVDATQSKASEAVDSIDLGEVIEVIPCSIEGEKSLRGAKWVK